MVCKIGRGRRGGGGGILPCIEDGTGLFEGRGVEDDDNPVELDDVAVSLVLLSEIETDLASTLPPVEDRPDLVLSVV